MTRAVQFAITTALIIAAPVHALAAEIIAERTLPRGTIVSADDLSNADDAPELIGLETMRTLRVGSVIEARYLQTPRLVKRNEMVTLVFMSGRLRMETQGRSLGEGGHGDTINVMNANSRQRITGRVIGPGLVEVSK